MSEELDFRKSKDRVGYIYPILVDKDTYEIIDGKHRRADDPRWPEKMVETKNLYERTLIRMHANYRRKVSRKERQAQMILLAKIAEEEGTPREEITRKLAEDTPYGLRYVEKLLPRKYKLTKFAPKRVVSRKKEVELVRPIAETKPVAKPKPKPLMCPSCRVELEKVLCPRCWTEIELKR